MSTVWGDSRDEFIEAWKVEIAPIFDIQAGGQTGEVLVTPTGARGWLDGTTYFGAFDGPARLLLFVFRLSADGLLNSQNKQLSYQSALENASPSDATGPAGTDPLWGTTIGDYEGSWALAAGEITIEHSHSAQATAQVHFDSVAGIQDGAYQADFDAQAKELRLTFMLQAAGHKDDDPLLPRQLVFTYPEIWLSTSTPTEGERYEEVDSGG